MNYIIMTFNDIIEKPLALSCTLQHTCYYVINSFSFDFRVSSNLEFLFIKFAKSIVSNFLMLHFLIRNFLNPNNDTLLMYHSRRNNEKSPNLPKFQFSRNCNV